MIALILGDSNDEWHEMQAPPDRFVN